jgi:hypothetical protein
MPNQVHLGTVTPLAARDRRRLISTWMSRRCIECGGRKPLITAYCDLCAERHGLT